jgi:chromosomal replication initiation ATPase DnaA
VNDRELIEYVAEKIAREHGYSMIAIRSRSRNPSVVRARDHVLAVLKWSTGLSFPELARFLGGRDHTSIISAVNRHASILNGEWDGLRKNRVLYFG